MHWEAVRGEKKKRDEGRGRERGKENNQKREETKMEGGRKPNKDAANADRRV